MIVMNVPYPPSNNHYYVRARNRTIISERGRAYTEAIKLSKKMHGISDTPLECRLYVQILVHAPNKARRDLDNVLKALLDSFTKAGVWCDDSQIDKLTIRRGESAPPHGMVSIAISEHQYGE